MCLAPRTAGRPSVMAIGGAVFSTGMSRIRSHDSALAARYAFRVHLYAHRVEMRGHAGLAHPEKNEIGGNTMFGRKENPRQMRWRLGNARELVDPADDLIAEGPLPYLRDIQLAAIHTPGHTEGSTCFYLPQDGVLFSGDLLFAGNVGRIDLPGGDAGQMEMSLARIATIPPATRVFPGHGPATTIGDELHWLRGFRFE